MAVLPVVGGDTGAWGTLLNTWLLVAHAADGTLKDVLSGTGSPEGVITGTVSQVYRQTDGVSGTAFWVKTSGSGNTGWEAVSMTVAQQNSQSGTAYTLALTDNGKVVEMSNAAANTVTVPPNSSVAFPIGTLIEIDQMGAGATSIAAGAGVTIRSAGGLLKLGSQYAAASLRKRATNEWVLVGDLIA